MTHAQGGKGAAAVALEAHGEAGQAAHAGPGSAAGAAAAAGLLALEDRVEAHTLNQVYAPAADNRLGFCRPETDAADSSTWCECSHHHLIRM